MADPIVFGFPRSTFVNIVRLVLTHKEVPYTLHDLEHEMGKPSHLALGEVDGGTAITAADRDTRLQSGLGWSWAYSTRGFRTFQSWLACHPAIVDRASQQRRALRELARQDGSRLEDLGLSREEALRECAKRFWK